MTIENPLLCYNDVSAQKQQVMTDAAADSRL
jgi:hypothetical protein